MNDEAWLTVEQAAEELQAALGRKNVVVTPTKVRSWLRTGKLIGQRVDGEWRVYRRDINAYVKNWKWGSGVYRGGSFSGR
jgi:hypothetical protein